MEINSKDDGARENTCKKTRKDPPTPSQRRKKAKNGHEALLNQKSERDDPSKQEPEGNWAVGKRGSETRKGTK